MVEMTERRGSGRCGPTEFLSVSVGRQCYWVFMRTNSKSTGKKNKRCCTEKEEKITLFAHGVGYSLCKISLIVIIVLKNEWAVHRAD